MACANKKININVMHQGEEVLKCFQLEVLCYVLRVVNQLIIFLHNPIVLRLWHRLFGLAKIV